MVSATKMREYLWVKGGIYLALALILSGALMLMASANMAYADTVTNKDGSKTETVTVKRTIVFSDGAGGQVADTVVQEATFTRTWYPDFEDAPAWQEVDFAAVSCPAVANYRANQTQVAAVTGVTPDNASSKLRDVTVTYTRTTTTTPGTAATRATSPTVTPPVSTSTTSASTSSSTTVTPTAPTVSTATSASSSSGLPGPATASTATTPQVVTPTTSTTTSSSSSGLPGPATPTSSSTTSTSSSTLQAPVSTTTSNPTPVSATTGQTNNPQSANQEPQITDYAWQIGAAVLGAGLVGAIAYIATSRRKADTPPSDSGTPTPSA